MAKVLWSKHALEDVEAIAEYIARDSSIQAELFVSRILEAVEHLQYFPQAGRIIPEIEDPVCREVIYRHYRIMYFLKENEVWVTQVIHSSRDW